MRAKTLGVLLAFSFLAAALVVRVNPASTVKVGGFFDSPYLANWYEPENNEGVVYRWTRAASSIYLPARLAGQPRDPAPTAGCAARSGSGFKLTLHLAFIPQAEGETAALKLAAGGRVLEEFELAPGFAAYTATIPPGAVVDHLDLVSPTFRPAGDARDLGLQVDWFRLQPLPPRAFTVWSAAPLALLVALLTAGLYAFLLRLKLSRRAAFAGAVIALALLTAGLLAFTAETEALLGRLLLGLALSHLAWIVVERFSPEWRGGRLYVLFGSGLVLAIVLRMVLTASPGTYYDVFAWYFPWAQRMLAGGLNAVYSGSKFANQPPLFIYIFSSIQGAYTALTHSPTNLIDPTLVFLFHLPAVLSDVAIGLCLFVYQAKAPRLAVVSTLAFLLAPPVILDSAYSGRTASVYTLFILLAFLALARGWKIGPLAFIAVAALIKPQPWLFVPIVLLFALRRSGWRALLQDAGVAALVAAIVLLPVLLSGAFGKMVAGLLAGVGTTSGMVSADAYNFWWFVTRGNNTLSPAAPLALPGGMTLPFTYAQASFVSFALVYAGALVAAWRRNTNAALLEAAALIGFAIYMLPTGMVDNYMLHSFPFLALLLFENWSIPVVYVLLSLTSTINPLLQSSYILVNLRASNLTGMLNTWRWYDAALNTAILLLWLVSFAARYAVNPRALYQEGRSPRANPLETV